MLPDRQSGVLASTLQSHILLVGRAGFEPAMFTLRVPVLQTGAFTITLPAVSYDRSGYNNRFPFSFSFLFYSCLQLPFLSVCLYGQMFY